jgi:hypothetical protein
MTYCNNMKTTTKYYNVGTAPISDKIIKIGKLDTATYKYTTAFLSLQVISTPFNAHYMRCSTPFNIRFMIFSTPFNVHYMRFSTLFNAHYMKFSAPFNAHYMRFSTPL